MAVTEASFQSYFAEFSDTPSTYIAPYLANAIARTPAAVWGDLQDQGVLYLTAHLMAISPMGINAKLASKDGSSVYGKERMRLARIVTAGIRVTGQNANDPLPT